MFIYTENSYLAENMASKIFLPPKNKIIEVAFFLESIKENIHTDKGPLKPVNIR